METNSQQPAAEQSAQERYAPQQSYSQQQTYNQQSYNQSYNQQPYNQQPYGNQAYGAAPAPIIVTDEGKLYLKSTGSWAMFLAVLGIIGIVFLLFAGIITIVGASKVGNISSYDYYGTSVHNLSSVTTAMYIVGIVYVVLALVYIYPVKCLMTFNSKVKMAILTNSTADMTAAFKNMKGYFKFLGMLIIISFVLGLLAIIIAMAAM